MIILYYSEVFILTHRTGELALLMLIPALSNIGLNLILIPQFELLGAVIATLASYALGLAVLAARGHRLIALPMPLGDLLKTGLAAASMAPAIWLMPTLGSWPELFLKIAAGGTIYAIMAFVLDAGGARGFVRDKLASRGHASA